MKFVDLLMVLDYRQSVIDSLRDWADHSITDAEAWHLRQVAGDIRSMEAAYEA